MKLENSKFPKCKLVSPLDRYDQLAILGKVFSMQLVSLSVYIYHIN